MTQNKDKEKDWDELIEACGDTIYSLERIKPDGNWRAVARWITKSFEGKTPEEAVARLWLTLNKQK